MGGGRSVRWRGLWRGREGKSVERPRKKVAFFFRAARFGPKIATCRPLQASRRQLSTLFDQLTYSTSQSARCGGGASGGRPPGRGHPRAWRAFSIPVSLLAHHPPAWAATPCFHPDKRRCHPSIGGWVRQGRDGTEGTRAGHGTRSREGSDLSRSLFGVHALLLVNERTVSPPPSPLPAAAVGRGRSAFRMRVPMVGGWK